MKNIVLKLNEVSEEKYANSALRKSLEGQKEFYTELLESKEGFPQGIIYVLENPSMFKGSTWNCSRHVPGG